MQHVTYQHSLTPFIRYPVLDTVITCLSWGYIVEAGALREVVLLLQAVRQIKGILNKLTPENFDRLLQQVLDIVIDAELLHATIKLVFENAVAQPTFSFMYAQFCAESSKVPPASLASPCLTHIADRDNDFLMDREDCYTSIRTTFCT